MFALMEINMLATTSTPGLSAKPATPRARIIAAAIACFARSGFHGASMQAICAEAQMSPGALYRYFPSKEAIIAAIAEAEHEHHAAFFDRMAAAEDPVEALASIGVEALETLLLSPTNTLQVETMAEAIRNPEIRAGFQRNCNEARATIAAALVRGQARGQVDPDLDIDIACQLVMALGDGLAAHQALDANPSPERLRPVLQILLRRFFRPPSAS